MFQSLFDLVRAVEVDYRQHKLKAVEYGQCGQNQLKHGMFARA